MFVFLPSGKIKEREKKRKQEKAGTWSSTTIIQRANSRGIIDRGVKARGERSGEQRRA